MRKKLTYLVFAIAAILTTNANAWFFFIPGSVISKIGDGLTGSEGENCVSEKAKVGDVLKSGTGNTATIKSLSGTSSRCQDSVRPIRALLVFSLDHKSTANFSIPDGYQPKELNDFQKYNGILVIANSSDQRKGVTVSTKKRDRDSNPTAIVREMEQRLSSIIEDAKTTNAEQIKIKELDAWRFELTGKNKGIFGQRYTYQITVIEGEKEYLSINAWCQVDNYDKEKDGFKQMSESVVGLTSASINPAPNTPASNSGLSVKVEQSNSDTVTVPANAPRAIAPTASASTPNAPSIALPSSNAASAAESSSSSKKLIELHKLFKDGVINQSDFETKKQEILKSM